MPRPSESTTLGVSAPGRWILASAMRRPVERGRGARAAAAIRPAATKRSNTNTAAAVPTKMTATRRS